MSGEAILSAENSGKPLADRGYAPHPAGGAHSAPRSSSWWGGGCCPSPGTTTPTLGLWLFDLAPMKNPEHALARLGEFNKKIRRNAYGSAEQQATGESE